MESEACRTDYEVFLSFRGPDVRRSLADVLYDHMERAGIRVFRDNDELAVGDNIEPVILQAIERSQICVPIFSETFAASRWCLGEITRMAKLKKEVVPVFYNVTPADVKLKTPVYKSFMAEHEAVFGKRKVDKWEGALKAMAKLKGREVLTMSYTKFCKKFIEDLLIKLKPRRRYDLANLVGLDDQLESAMKLLDIGAGGVRYIVIHGMGGIGKTTLAKAIFNKLSRSFDYCSFLENLQESVRRGGLQKQPRDSLDPRSAAKSLLCGDIGERFYGKRVLIVLDDVDTGEQINKLVGKSWFASGSRILITTRKLNVLNECEDLDEDSIKSLEMRTLQYAEALRLFTSYAFVEDPPPSVYKNLSEEAISGTGGLPLTIKVIASHLRGKNQRVWRDVIARSRKIPPKEVKNRLKISYDALDQDQQQIFLDIACFFIDTNISNPCYMWEACGFYPYYGLEVLISLSLVKITDDNVIWMHEQLRDLGRDIIRDESINDPTKRSRIWLQQDALKVLNGKQDRQAVEALTLRTPLDNALSDENLASFQNIRFLELAGENCEGSSNNLLEKLIWLSWQFCPVNFNICNFSLENLVILDLSHSLIDENWGGWSQIQMACNLKVLDLRSCCNLSCTPDFSKNYSLERLILSGCSKLAMIHSSIQNLTSLQSLDLRFTDSLGGLPEELSFLEDLKEIFVSGNSKSFAFSLPKSIGKLVSLTSLSLEKLEMNCIPDSIAGLVKLKHLSVACCHGVKEIPESLGNLESLVELDLSWTGVIELPTSIGALVKLKKLRVDGCFNIKELPGSLWCLKSLTSLDLSYTQVSNLSSSIGDLQELQVLVLSGCKIRILPASIGRLKKLEVFQADACEYLEEVPPEIGGLSGLRKLDLSYSSIRRLPSTVSELSLLRQLHLEYCDQLEEVPELPQGLINLTVSSHCLKKACDLSKLDMISSFVLNDINDVEIIQRLPSKLKELVLVLSAATPIPFDLSSLTQLKSLSLISQPLRSTSSSLLLSPGNTSIKLPHLSNMNNLCRIEFQDILMEDGLDNLGVRELKNLETVWIVNCSGKLIEACLSKNLRTLSIARCKSLKSLPALSHLKALVCLDIGECEELTQILGLEELESLNWLYVYWCNSMERIGNLSELKQLSILSIDGCPKLSCIEGIDKLFLRDLSITNCDRWNLQERRFKHRE